MRETKHFEMTDEVKFLSGVKLHRIRATRDSMYVTAGTLGGWVEKEDNLQDSAWVADEACVYRNAQVTCNEDYCCFQSCWNGRETITAFKTTQGIAIKSGQFFGTIEQFIRATDGALRTSRYERESIVEEIKVRFGIR